MLTPNPSATTSANLLLASLPPADFERILPHLSPISLQLGQVLLESGQMPEQVYFVQEGLLSYIIHPQTGIGVEVGLVGREGVGCAMMTLAEAATPIQILVQGSGDALMMSAQAFRAEMQRAGSLYQGVMRHLSNLFLMSAQGGLCNRQHTIEERLSRWLLQMQDRVDKEELELRGDFLALMLGSRGVSERLCKRRLNYFSQENSDAFYTPQANRQKAKVRRTRADSSSLPGHTF